MRSVPGSSTNLAAGINLSIHSKVRFPLDLKDILEPDDDGSKTKRWGYSINPELKRAGARTSFD